MADNLKQASTPNYTMGYSEAEQQRLSLRTAANNAEYLLPHLMPGMRLLDVGCGPGSISVGLAAAVDPGEFYGIDMEKAQLELAVKAAREAGHSNVRFQVADALNLPFPENYFDVVHCRSVLMHVPDTMAVLAEIKRVLKSGGILGAREWIGDSSFIEPDFGNLNRVPSMISAVFVANGGHPQMGKELRARISEAGFVGIESNGAFESYGSPAGIAAFADFITQWVGPRWAETAIAHGIATREDFEQWRDAAIVWKDQPGAFACWSSGEAIGRKP